MRSSAELVDAGRTAGVHRNPSLADLAVLAALATVVAGCSGLGLEPARTADPTSCPEIVLVSLPEGHRQTARKRLLPDQAVSPLRTDIEGPAGRRLTFLSGFVGELGGAELGLRQVDGRPASLVLTPAGTLALAWSDATAPPGCLDYAVVGSGYAPLEFDALIVGLRILGP